MTNANAWDADIKLLYPADQGTNFAVEVLGPADPFDVVADVEIGEDLNENVDEHVLRVSIINLTTAAQVAFNEVKKPLVPQNNTKRREQLRVPFGPVANSNSGDVLQVVASYKVTAGTNVDQSTEQSETFSIGG
jgi:hypothetical protein